MSERRILVVDDESSLRKVLSDLLRLRGFDPVAVGSGEEAVDKLKKQSFAVAIIDLALHEGGGRMDGMELLQQVREKHAQTECVVLTGAPSQQSAIQAVSAGAFSYLLKPFNVTELVGTLERAMEHRQEHQALVGAKEHAEEATTRTARLIGGLRSECVSALGNLIALAQNIVETNTLNDAQAFGRVIQTEAQGLLDTIEELIEEHDSTVTE